MITHTFDVTLKGPGCPSDGFRPFVRITPSPRPGAGEFFKDYAAGGGRTGPTTLVGSDGYMLAICENLGWTAHELTSDLRITERIEN
jgi:hypothetical protein